MANSSQSNYALIHTPEGISFIVDPEWFERLNKYTWRAEIFHSSMYAVTDITVRGHPKKLRMHRLIANTPPGKITHHINHITLDNRRKNLLNVTKDEHDDLHSRNRILIKYDRTVDKTTQNLQ